MVDVGELELKKIIEDAQGVPAGIFRDPLGRITRLENLEMVSELELIDPVACTALSY